MNPEKYEIAKGIFKDTKLKIANEGKRHLRASSSSWHEGVQKGICVHKGKRIGKVTVKNY